jgi:ATP-dependent DNA helicase RecG
VALLERGLLEGDASEYCISLDVAKKTRQLPEYTRNRGLDKSKIQQMILQYLQNAGSTGAKRDAIFDYSKEVLPQNKTHEQQERMLGNILSEMKENGLIVPEGRTWFLKS